MKLAEVDKIYPNGDPKAGSDGTSALVIDSSYYGKDKVIYRSNFNGISRITVFFIDDSINGFLINYEPSSDSNFKEAFFKKIDQEFGLNGSLVKSNSGDIYEKKCDCKDFSIEAKVSLQKDLTYEPTLHVHDTKSDEIIRNRRLQERQEIELQQKKKREEFKL